VLESSTLNLKPVFVLLFVTIGPIKTIVPFLTLSAGNNVKFRTKLALGATIASSLIVLLLFVVGSLIVQKWGISFDAITLTGGIVLFLLSLQVMIKTGETTVEKTDNLSMGMLISRLVIPTIISPAGVTAILALSVISQDNQNFSRMVLYLLLLIMLLNMISMLLAKKLLSLFTVAGLRVIGWVFAVLQASLGIQIILNTLRRLNILAIQ
jgi:multiple antibiotic resistance protein